MIRGALILAQIVGLLASLVLSGCGASVSDTGYVGTWRRDLGEGYSEISLEEDRQSEGGYRFTWELRDGNRTVSCERNGLCTERIDGRAMYEHRFRVARREGSSDLFVECKGEPVVEGVFAQTYVDRLVLQPGGLELLSFVVEVDGVSLQQATEPLRFAKHSDAWR